MSFHGLSLLIGYTIKTPHAHIRFKTRPISSPSNETYKAINAINNLLRQSKIFPAWLFFIPRRGLRLPDFGIESLVHSLLMADRPGAVEKRIAGRGKKSVPSTGRPHQPV